MKLKNTKALITGASLGLGKSIAAKFLSEGADVAICARMPGDLEATHEELSVRFPERRVLSQVCDVSDEAQVSTLFERIREEFGSLDSLVLNAGIYGPMGPTESVDLAEWRRAIDVNLFGVLLPCRAAIPEFKRNGRGKIIVLSGGGATNPLPNISAYAASKAAVVRLVETLAEELREFCVAVNAIAPGAMATRLMDQVLAAGPERVGTSFFEKTRQWKESGATPPDLGARLAVYLASRESDGITGKLISAQWDGWATLHEHLEELRTSDIFCLRRIVPSDRNKTWT